MPKCSFTGSMQNLLVKRIHNHFDVNTDCFNSRFYNNLYAMICLQTDKHFRSSILSKPPGLFSEFFFHVLGFGRNWFVIQENLLLFLLICGFRNGLVFFRCFSINSVKKLGYHLIIFGCLGGYCCIKSLENFSCSFIQNRLGKFYSHLGIVVKVHFLFSKVW